MHSRKTFIIYVKDHLNSQNYLGNKLLGITYFLSILLSYAIALSVRLHVYLLWISQVCLNKKNGLKKIFHRDLIAPFNKIIYEATFCTKPRSLINCSSGKKIEKREICEVCHLLGYFLQPRVIYSTRQDSKGRRTNRIRSPA